MEFVSHKQKREVTLRELKEAEEETIIEISQAVFRKYLPSIQPNLRDDFISYIYEEAVIYALKFNGNGSLSGYLYSSLNSRAKIFSRDMFYIYSPLDFYESKKSDEGTSTADTIINLRYEDVYCTDTSLVDKFFSRLVSKEKKVAQMLYDGYSIKEISEEINTKYYFTRKIVQSVKDKLKEEITNEK